MDATLTAALDGPCVLLAMASGAYLIFAISCVGRFRPRKTPAYAASPPLTVFKPLCGSEPRLYECLRSFCMQDHPNLQIVCGMAAEDRAATAIVHRLMREFPALDIDLVIDGTLRGSNRKVSNLINMMPRAKYDVLIVSDSDARIEGDDFLRHLVAALGDPALGAVTCPYRGMPEAGFASALGALFIDDWYFPQALIAQRLGPVDSCFGPVTAVRRAALECIGGFAALAD
jgi:ceramide glucosyltransferase